MTVRTGWLKLKRMSVTDWRAPGSIVWQATYRSWGEIELLKINQVEQNLRFQGQYLDSETALHQGRGTQRKMYYGIGIIIHLGPIRPLNRYFLATAKLAKILTGGSSSEFLKIAVGLRKPRAYKAQSEPKIPMRPPISQLQMNIK